MHISKVELENFKSYENSSFEFGRGTTSITGENGAGKTSIIEAIAWTIFDTLDYKKEDIVRRGAKKGSARVTFESGIDEREYTVYRDTGNGYYVYDPKLQARIADKKEEVTRFLWQHLGIEPGTDLELLFRHAIGVPQGTFTAIFLATAAERKKTFDGLLKVEEYRRSSDELLKTVRFVEQQIHTVNVRIAHAEGETARISALEKEQRNIKAQAADLKFKLEQLNDSAKGLQQKLVQLDEAEAELARRRAEAERALSELSRVKLILDHAQAEADQARKAAKCIAEIKDDAQKHQSALGRMAELERERGERQVLRDELAKIEAALSSVNAEQKHLLKDIEKIREAHVEIGSLRPLASEQDKLEQKIAAKRLELTNAEHADGRLKGVEERLADLREAYRSVSATLADAREKALAAAELTDLEARVAKIVRELAETSAALERDERFQREVKNGLCPILSAKCLNLKEGETLENFISSQFGELRARIDVLKTEQDKTSNALRSAREAELSGARIPVLEKRLEEIRAEGEKLRSQKDELETGAAALPIIHDAVAQIETELKKLDNPLAKIQMLERDARREGTVNEQISSSERNIERLESERRITVEKLESYKDLDQLLAETSDQRDRTADAYRKLLANEAAAGQADQKEAAHAEAAAVHAKAVESAANTEKAAAAAAAAYGRDLHLAQRSAFLDVQKRQAEAEVMRDSATRRDAELTEEIERLYEVRRSMQAEFRERERLKKVAEATDFIRSTLRDAAPLVAKNYVHHVSREANQLFREISGEAECTLKWTEDYGIQFEEAGHDRPFQSLSGGEQMAAALAVRLALLKQLSDIHIAFFDEPTTNMDAERRENLAMQIGNIGSINHFDQLFVISHDDTFEGYTDHEIRVRSETEH